jgi:hypothetical protein
MCIEKLWIVVALYRNYGVLYHCDDYVSLYISNLYRIRYQNRMSIDDF